MAECAQAGDILGRLARAEARAIGGRESFCETQGQRRCAPLFLEGEQFVLDRFAPSAKQGLELFFESRFVGLLGAFANVEDEPQHGEIAAFDLEAPVQQSRFRAFFEQAEDLQAHLRGEHVARHPYEGKEVAGQGGFDQGQARARPVDQAHHGGGDARGVFFGKADHEIVRQGREGVDQRLAGMAGVVEIQFVADGVEPFAQDRDAARRRGDCSARPDAGVDRKGRNLLAVADRDDEQVERHAAVHARHVVRLDDQRRACFALALEPGEGPFVAGIDQQLAGGSAADAKLVFLRSVAFANDMAQLREHARIQPFEQRGAFIVIDPVDIGAHRFLELWPIAHGGADVGERFQQGLLD